MCAAGIQKDDVYAEERRDGREPQRGQRVAQQQHQYDSVERLQVARTRGREQQRQRQRHRRRHRQRHRQLHTSAREEARQAGRAAAEEVADARAVLSADAGARLVRLADRQEEVARSGRRVALQTDRCTCTRAADRSPVRALIRLE